MKRVLITGMSGTGKSTLICALAARGHKAIDLDTDEWSHWVPDAGADPFGPASTPGSVWEYQDWVWREDRVACLLATEDAEVLFVGGTAANQGKFHPQFDQIVLLRAPTSVLIERLSSRTTNDYGKDPDELARVLQHVETVEPLLRRVASVVVDTSVPLDYVTRVMEDLRSSVSHRDAAVTTQRLDAKEEVGGAADVLVVGTRRGAGPNWQGRRDTGIEGDRAGACP